MKSIEMTGKTVEDAVRAGLKELGCESSDVDIDVLHMGSPGLFGMFGKLARVRLTVKEDDPELDIDLSDLSLSLDKPKAGKARPEKKPAQPAPKQAEPPKPAEEKPAEPVAKPQPEIARKAEPAAENRPEPETAHKKEPEPAAVRPVADKPASGRTEPFEPSDPETLGEAGRLAYDFLANVTEKMGVNVRIRVTEEEGHLTVAMMGDTLGILIGRRGDTLDALQYLTSLQVNKHRDGYIRVSLDSENYRRKREEALSKLALRMASRARKTGHKVTLEPMNPYERRILHSALQNNPYVTTHSEGEEPYRRVVITLRQNGEEA